MYYWNSLPANLEVEYPGKAMTADSTQGTNWFTMEFPDINKINFMFIVNGNQSAEMTQTATGEYWYKDGKWYKKNPEKSDPISDWERTDMREDSIYFLMTTRFYDGECSEFRASAHFRDPYSAQVPDRYLRPQFRVQRRARCYREKG